MLRLIPLNSVHETSLTSEPNISMLSLSVTAVTALKSCSVPDSPKPHLVPAAYKMLFFISFAAAVSGVSSSLASISFAIRETASSILCLKSLSIMASTCFFVKALRWKSFVSRLPAGISPSSPFFKRKARYSSRCPFSKSHVSRLLPPPVSLMSNT
ncbi:MAG: hypothetical protein HFH67_10485 [Lachnospiraceae bacterium]|nr:hypothetical protein [Lachnospiraceae bacterium]